MASYNALVPTNGLLMNSTLIPAINAQSLAVGSLITAGTPVTLPNSMTYTGAELHIFLNGDKLTVTQDYNYVSSTQVSFTIDLQSPWTVLFVTDRLP